MISVIRKSSAGRGLFAVMLLLALTIRAFVPTGYMPVQTSTGIVVTLCSGDGARQTLIEIPAFADQTDHQGTPEGKTSLCAFAATTSGFFLGTGTVQLAVSALLLREIFIPPPVPATLPHRFLSLPPLRGPPPAA